MKFCRSIASHSGRGPLVPRFIYVLILSFAVVGCGHGELKPETQVLGNAPRALSLGSEQALRKLFEGNQRYVQDRLIHPDQSRSRVREVSNEQHPIAAILGCADSRVPPEIIFDQGIGDLFVVREAGNIIDDAVIASMEYAAVHLGVSLIFILGHERCGAIEAAVHNQYEGHIGTLVDAISPAIDLVQGKEGDPIDLVSRAHVDLVRTKLMNSRPVLRARLESKQLLIVSGYYDLDSGRVEILKQ